jgi:chemotaxis protein methyltransferase CheR
LSDPAKKILPDHGDSQSPREDGRDSYIALQKDTAGFHRLSALLRQNAGINLPENQKNLGLMASRLLSTMRAHGCDTYSQYLHFLSRAGEPGIKEFLECLTTNTTEFFREPAHFDFLRDILAGTGIAKDSGSPLLEQREVRIWCGAASSGQEPYSILMNVFVSMAKIKQFPDIKFLATDIDRSMLEAASRGVYSESEIKSLPTPYREQWFKEISRSESGQHSRYLADRQLRESITFAPLNLVEFPYPFQHKFDIIFLRNVLIYFDRETGQRVVSEIAKFMRPGAFLFLGHSEAGVLRPDSLKPVANAVYKRLPDRNK